MAHGIIGDAERKIDGNILSKAPWSWTGHGRYSQRRMVTKILHMDKITQAEMKEVFANEFYKNWGLVSASKLNGRNNISAINT